MASRIASQIPLEFFPCKNCLLALSQKYPDHDFNLKETADHDTLLILKNAKIVKEEIVEKMTPDAGFVKGIIITSSVIEFTQRRLYGNRS